MALRTTALCLFVYNNCEVVRKAIQKSSKEESKSTGSNSRRKEAPISVQKIQGVSGSSMKPQEASGGHNIKRIINKQKNKVTHKSTSLV